MMPAGASPSRESFLEYVGDWSGRIAKPAAVKILSEVVTAETAPPDTLVAIHRSYKEAIALLWKSADRTAKEIGVS